MKKKEFLLYAALYVIWLLIVLIAGIHHEPWADEAQSWLIARDNTSFDIITKVLRYEGHPALWYLILRFLYLLNFPYDAIYLIPLLFSAVGVYLFMFKTRLPVIIKCLFPFTFFIAYQYSVTARSYCLLFPLLMVISVFYKYRLKRPLLYSFLLILLMSSETYNFIIAFVLFIFFIYDICESKQYNIKTISATLLITAFFIITGLYMLPPADCVCKYPFELSAARMSKFLVHGYFQLRKDFSISINELIITLFFYLSAMIIFCKKQKDILLMIALNGSVITAISGFVCHFWHNGYGFLTLIFSIAILCEENNITTSNKYIKNLFFTIFTVFSVSQIAWSSSALISDYSEPYTEAKELANAIKIARLDEYGISAIGYNTVAVQPYFKQNIYNNFKHSYYEWSEEADKYITESAKKQPPVIVIEAQLEEKYYDLISSIDENAYNIYTFNQIRCLNGTILKAPEFYLYVSKDILSSLKL